MKIVRALVAAAAALCTAAVLQVTAASPAAAALTLHPGTTLCGACWAVGNN